VKDRPGSDRAGPARQPPIGILIAQVGRQLDRAFDEALVRAGGSRPTWLILLAVKSGAGDAQARIATRVGISGPTLIHHLDRLAAAGLITRTRDEQDRRTQKVALTATGLDVFVRLREAAVGFDHLIHAGLSDDETGELRRLLTTISANVTGERDHRS
jgi:MarR family transcriptional regulator for hemolysin